MKKLPFRAVLLGLLASGALFYAVHSETPTQAAVEMPAASYLKGLSWLGHAAFKLVRGEVTIYMDPWKIQTTPHDADIILVSHPHFDHLDTDDIAKIAKQDTVIVTVEGCALKIEQAHLPGSVLLVKPGDKVKVKGIQIEAVPAYNTNKVFHLRQNQWVGFIIEIDGERIYFAGDTDLIPEMKNFNNIDVALLPVSGTYCMNAVEAAQAVKIMNPKVSVPMHYGTIVGSAADAKKFQSLCSSQIVEILPSEKK